MKIHTRQQVWPILALAVMAVNLATVQSGRAGSFTNTGSLNVARELHTATLLQNGQVLVAGGAGVPFNALASTELYNPAAATWATNGAMLIARNGHKTTLLTNGQVLVSGGFNSVNGYLAEAELYDPVRRVWTNTGAPNGARAGGGSALLPDGKVLMAGGFNGAIISSAELYDPAGRTWTITGAMNTARDAFTATVLSNGKVLVAGGFDPSNNIVASAEIYDPATKTWTNTGAMTTGRTSHTATLLPNGQVLVTGGEFGPAFLSSAELYDPVAGTWTATSSMAAARGGHSATLLPNGQVLVAGGADSGGVPLSSVELYDPASGTWTNTMALLNARSGHTATLLANGQVLMAGGSGTNGITNSTELYDPGINPRTGTWTNTGSMNVARYLHTATLLTNGKVLAAGGYTTNTNSAEIYDPILKTWTMTSPMKTARSGHMTTLLPNGKVLVSGGGSPNFVLASAELYDPTLATWTNTGVLNNGRYEHTSTLLPNGKVLVAGGIATNSQYNSLFSAELYDPGTGQWRMTRSMANPRYAHTATLLPNGKVLVAGGIVSTFDGYTLANSAELFDPTTEMWTNAGVLNIGRGAHTATLLPNGKVLVAGGVVSLIGGSTNSAELYDPAIGTWTPTGSMGSIHAWHTAVLLPNGKVLVTGGNTERGPPMAGIIAIPDADLYDPATGTWTFIGLMNSARYDSAATLLSSGKVLVTGGNDGTNPIFGVELYDSGQSFSNSWQPQIAMVTSPLSIAGSLTVTGSGFRGIAEGSGGNLQSSAADYPLVQLRSLERGQTMFLPCTNWSTNTFNSAPVWGFPPGWAMATVFVNGIPSTSGILNITVPVPTLTTLTNVQRLTNGTFQFAFTNTPGAVLGALATTNVALPLTNWTALGGVTEILPGQFQFSDPQVTNNATRFYVIRAP